MKFSNDIFNNDKIFETIKLLNQQDISKSADLSNYFLFSSAENGVDSFLNSIDFFPYNGAINERLEWYKNQNNYGKYLYNEWYPKNIGCLLVSGSTGSGPIIVGGTQLLSGLEFTVQSYIKVINVEATANVVGLWFNKEDYDNNLHVGISGSNYTYTLTLGGSPYSSDILDGEVIQNEFHQISLSGRFYETNNQKQLKIKFCINGINKDIRTIVFTEGGINFEHIFGIGGADAANTDGNDFVCYYKEIRLWKKYLSTYEIQKYYNKNIYKTDDLILYYRFNDYTGASLKDHSGIGLNGEIEGEIYSWSNNVFSGSQYSIVEKAEELPVGLEAFMDFEESEPLSTEVLLEEFNDKYTSLKDQAIQYDNTNDYLIVKLIPGHYSDNENAGDFLPFLYELGSYLDKLKFLIDGIKDKEKIWNLKMDDYVVGDMVLKHFGFSGGVITNNLSLIDYFLFEARKHNLYDYSGVKSKITKSIKENLIHLYKSKGTINSLISLLNILFIPRSSYSFMFGSREIDNTALRMFDRYNNLNVLLPQYSHTENLTGSTSDIHIKLMLPTDANESAEYELIKFSGSDGNVAINLQQVSEENIGMFTITALSGTTFQSDDGNYISDIFYGTEKSYNLITTIVSSDTIRLRLYDDVGALKYNEDFVFSSELNVGNNPTITLQDAYYLSLFGKGAYFSDEEIELYNKDIFKVYGEYLLEDSIFTLFKWFGYGTGDEYTLAQFKTQTPLLSRNLSAQTSKPKTLIFDPLYYNALYNLTYTYEEKEQILNQWFYGITEFLNNNKFEGNVFELMGENNVANIDKLLFEFYNLGTDIMGIIDNMLPATIRSSGYLFNMEKPELFFDGFTNYVLHKQYAFNNFNIYEDKKGLLPMGFGNNIDIYKLQPKLG